MVLTIVLSILVVVGLYEFIYDLISLPTWATLPLLVGLAAGIYFLPFVPLLIVAVGCAGGIVHALLRKVTTQQHAVQLATTRRATLPPLP